MLLSHLIGPIFVELCFTPFLSPFCFIGFAVETPESNGDDLLITKEFLESSIEYYSIPTKAFENNGQPFVVKHLNIIDPLKYNNNLGRSVGKGNFHRIRYAFSYGARKLREILVRPGERMSAGLRKFFVTTLDRNGRGHRPDVQVPVPAFGAGRSDICDLSGNYDNYFSGLFHGQWYQNYNLSIPAQLHPHPLPPTSPSLFQNKGAFMQFNQDEFSLRKTNDFVPKPFSHPNDSQLLNAALSVEETANFRGTGTCILATSVREELKSRGTGTYILGIGVEEKLKSRGTGTFIPNLGVEEKMIPRGTGTYCPDVGVEEKLKSQGASTLIGNMGVEEKLNSQGSTSIAEMGVEGTSKLGGTEINNCEQGMEETAISQRPGTCIPDTIAEERAKSVGTSAYYPDDVNSFQAHSACSKMHVRGRGTNPENKAQGFLMKTSVIVEQFEVSSESEKDGSSSCCFDLSIEEFPLLPSSKKAVPSENHKSVQSTTESPQARKSSPRINIEFGSFGHSPAPSVLSSPVASKQPDPGVSTTMDSMLGFLTIAAQGPPKSSKRNKETVLVQPYQLADDNEFPPLCP